MGLSLLHAEWEVLQLTQLAISEYVFQDIEVLSAYFERLSQTKSHISSDALDYDRFFSRSECSIPASSIYMLELLFNLVKRVDPCIRVRNLH